MSDFNNVVVELEINDYDLKNRFEEATNNLIQENNIDIVSKMLVNDILNQSIEELEDETEQNITGIITNGKTRKNTKTIQ